MLYRLLKAYARLAIRIFCRRIFINKKEWLQADGPLLLCANHPNSFLDGIILTILLNKPLYSLARGDAFAHPALRRLIDLFHLLPVYRTQEGPENLGHNYTTFAACREVFRNKGMVLIFSEGGCVNEWHLRPLRKGTARLALSAWQEGIPLTVLPMGLNYSPFRSFGKNVWIGFGTPLRRAAIEAEESEGRRFAAFNAQLKEQLQELVWELNPADPAQLARVRVRIPLWRRLLLALPALAGTVLHAPLYFPVKWGTRARFNNDHFDSVVVALLLLLYPPYLLLAAVLLWTFAGPVFLLALPLLPLCAWAAVEVKEQ
ncbi:MAG: glycerol acyltransferase [Chitinophagaceae bacterium]|nr:MAG: glycerol acyltransferase [Chitinophagaceae bacterium]